MAQRFIQGEISELELNKRRDVVANAETQKEMKEIVNSLYKKGYKVDRPMKTNLVFYPELLKHKIEGMREKEGGRISISPETGEGQLSLPAGKGGELGLAKKPYLPKRIGNKGSVVVD